MTTESFNESVNREIKRRLSKAHQEYMEANKANWPSVEEQQAYWEKHDHGGNVLPDRIASNHDRYDNERHPFA